MGTIEFTDNYEDLSTDKGFQFRFSCERCGNGHLSTYQARVLGTAGDLLGAAGSLFGGLFGQVAEGAYSIQRAVGGKAHDEALRAAVTEIRPMFLQCRRCGTWTCSEVCYNPAAKMCKQCAPIAEQEETALRAENVRTQVANDLTVEEEARLKVQTAAVNASCAQCGSPTLGKKFCPDCGAPTALAVTNCSGCGAKLTPGAKFCGECGTKTKPG